jgi:beta-galactosidase GanA
MGADLLLLDQWRQPWAGQDMSRAGIVTATGRWTGTKDALAQLAAQFKEQAEYLSTRPPVEARVGVVMSNESAWAFSIEPPEPDFEYEKVWRDDFYLPIAQSHYWRDVIDQTADFCPYHVIVMPLVPMVFRPTKDRLKEWVEGGGCLLIGPLTGHRTDEFTAWTDQEFGGLEELMGATCSGNFSTAEGEDGATILWGAENIAAPETTENPIPSSSPRGLCYGYSATTAHVLARYRGGDAAILMNKVGQGTVITLGARVDRESYLDLIHTLCELAKIEPLATGSAHVAVIPRMNPDTSIAAYGVVNLTSERQTITLTKSGADRLTGRTVGPEIHLEPLEVMLVEVG